MEQRYETKESFDVVGMNISTTMKETKNKIEIPQLWGNFHKRFNEIQNRIAKTIKIQHIKSPIKIDLTFIKNN